MCTHIVVFIEVVIVLGLVVHFVFFIFIILFVVDGCRLRMGMTGKAAVDTVVVGSCIWIWSRIVLTCHTSFCELFHHFDEFLAVVLQ